ncbi:YHYH protein [Flavobacterium sp.]|uniref:YHYH protein n=2 Tax=Flavobacterium sp. TaxID=239 RepID=UPI004048A6E6
MKKITLLLFVSFFTNAQTNPAITSWLQNNTTTGYYYLSGNSTPISNGILVNCQQVRYSTNWVYINATGMPAYKVGPFTGDGNPNQAGDQNAIFKIPLNPTENTGTKTPTSGGNIGIFINGVAMFDFRDGVAWNTSTNSVCGGPGNPPCPGGPATVQSWNRDAVLYEKPGFDCSKGHPAGTNYHHHQNPSAFDLDLNVISTICNLYDGDGLYAINPSQHSPLIGYAYDGFPIYGAYGYANTNGTGGITRMKSGYQLRNITVRTHWADGTDVSDGPAVSATYPLGSFREDYEWVAHPSDESYLDEHNGRFCVTPEYPAGIYCYFATVDANHNSAYPYLIGPTYYGNKTGAKVTSVTESTTTYILASNDFNLNNKMIKVFPNPASDLIAIQIGDLVTSDLKIELFDITGRLIKSNQINAGQTITYFDVQDIYNGTYLVKITDGKDTISKTIIIDK